MSVMAKSGPWLRPKCDSCKENPRWQGGPLCKKCMAKNDRIIEDYERGKDDRNR